ncbi:LysM peptidoglycan-binding domain-containing protein [Opitutaceae bacterium TAV4]|nr:LysM peptidoglycan-binding domain-containing protein [Opitutaceae bacterium TAV4]
MLKNISALFLGTGLFLAPFVTSTLHAQQNIAVDLANLRQELVLAQQRLGELALRVEQLERDNETLRQKTTAAARDAASTAYVNESVSESNRLLRAAITQSKSDTLQQVATQMEKLANQTNAAIDSLAKSINQRRTATAAPSVSVPVFPDSFPKEGTTYVVQKGDTLSSIAQKNGAKMQDIVNANKIADPTKLQVGQTLFIPGGK